MKRTEIKTGNISENITVNIKRKQLRIIRKTPKRNVLTLKNITRKINGCGRTSTISRQSQRRCDLELKWAVLFICFTILVMTLVEFIALDTKIQKAIELQEEINRCSYQVNKDQSDSIRLLKTDTQILMNIAINNDYCKEEE